MHTCVHAHGCTYPDFFVGQTSALCLGKYSSTELPFETGSSDVVQASLKLHVSFSSSTMHGLLTGTFFFSNQISTMHYEPRLASSNHFNTILRTPKFHVQTVHNFFLQCKYFINYILYFLIQKRMHGAMLN